jgi:hypothetical protein
MFLLCVCVCMYVCMYVRMYMYVVPWYKTSCSADIQRKPTLKYGLTWQWIQRFDGTSATFRTIKTTKRKVNKAESIMSG